MKNELVGKLVIEFKLCSNDDGDNPKALKRTLIEMLGTDEPKEISILLKTILNKNAQEVFDEDDEFEFNVDLDFNIKGENE